MNDERNVPMYHAPCRTRHQSRLPTCSEVRARRGPAANFNESGGTQKRPQGKLNETDISHRSGTKHVTLLVDFLDLILACPPTYPSPFILSLCPRIPQSFCFLLQIMTQSPFPNTPIVFLHHSRDPAPAQRTQLGRQRLQSIEIP